MHEKRTTYDAYHCIGRHRKHWCNHCNFTASHNTAQYISTSGMAAAILNLSQVKPLTIVGKCSSYAFQLKFWEIALVFDAIGYRRIHSVFIQISVAHLELYTFPPALQIRIGLKCFHHCRQFLYSESHQGIPTNFQQLRLRSGCPMTKYRPVGKFWPHPHPRWPFAV